MLRSIATLGILSLLVLQVGCSGSGASTSSSNSFRESLGSTSPAQLQKSIGDIVQRKYHYQFERETYTSEDIYVETRWRDDTALDDERAQGYNFARTRLIITARPRNRTPGVAATVSVTFRAECLLRGVAGDWIEAPMTAARKKKLKEIYTELKTEMTTGLRVI